MKRIFIDSKENAKLIRLTSEHGPLQCGFGGGRVWLSRNEDGSVISAWALRYLAEWRDITVSEGAGI